MQTKDENNGIVVLDRSTELKNRNRYMTDRKAQIFTRSTFDSNMPSIVGLSVQIEIEVEGVKKVVGKTKAVEARKLPKIRANLDNFGTEFTNMAELNTTDSSFKELLNTMLDSVLGEKNEQED
jgi:hypothetical protein